MPSCMGWASKCLQSASCRFYPAGSTCCTRGNHKTSATCNCCLSAPGMGRMMLAAVQPLQLPLATRSCTATSDASLPSWPSFLPKCSSWQLVDALYGSWDGPVNGLLLNAGHQESKSRMKGLQASANTPSPSSSVRQAWPPATLTPYSLSAP